MNPAAFIQLGERLRGCLITGIIGDAIGAQFENSAGKNLADVDMDWFVTDDSQLTIATCQAIAKDARVDPEKTAAHFLEWFNRGRITHTGSSTLKALRDLQAGAHWALAGRSGEYAAGNGAAMRIAPLAFKHHVSLQVVRDICSITHKNDEAYAAALAVYHSIRLICTGHIRAPEQIIDCIIPLLPDSLTRDRLILISEKQLDPEELAGLHFPTGYAAASVPFALLCAKKSGGKTFAEIMKTIIQIGGDTDTIASITGQVVGSFFGTALIPPEWMAAYEKLWIKQYVDVALTDWRP